MIETNSPSTYREMSKPFASAAEAGKAINAFWEELYELRKKHRMADVHVIIAANAIREDGQEGRTMLGGHIGSEEQSEVMCAYALGEAAANRQEKISRILGEKFIHKLNSKS